MEKCKSHHRHELGNLIYIIGCLKILNFFWSDFGSKMRSFWNFIEARSSRPFELNSREYCVRNINYSMDNCTLEGTSFTICNSFPTTCWLDSRIKGFWLECSETNLVLFHSTHYIETNSSLSYFISNSISFNRNFKHEASVENTVIRTIARSELTFYIENKSSIFDILFSYLNMTSEVSLSSFYIIDVLRTSNSKTLNENLRYECLHRKSSQRHVHCRNLLFSESIMNKIASSSTTTTDCSGYIVRSSIIDPNEISGRNGFINCVFNLILFIEHIVFIALGINKSTSFHGKGELRWTSYILRHNLIKYSIHKNVFVHRNGHTYNWVVYTKRRGFVHDMSGIVIKDSVHVAEVIFKYSSVLVLRIRSIIRSFSKCSLKFFSIHAISKNSRRISYHIVSTLRFLFNSTDSINIVLSYTMHFISCIAAKIYFGIFINWFNCSHY